MSDRVSATVNDEIKEKLKEFIDNNDVSKAEVVRSALDEFLSKKKLGEDQDSKWDFIVFPKGSSKLKDVYKFLLNESTPYENDKSGFLYKIGYDEAVSGLAQEYRTKKENFKDFINRLEDLGYCYVKRNGDLIVLKYDKYYHSKLDQALENSVKDNKADIRRDILNMVFDGKNYEDVKNKYYNNQ